ncbi:kinase-like domain-containing protein [Nemania serpens]|nr:kinase-like domain-containing protein [Nemania serpens]
MDVIEDVEVWKRMDDDPVFEYIHVLLRQGSRYYVAHQRDPLPENAYLKRPYLLNYGATDNCCTILIQEANIHEKLRLNPHKNIVRYYGCVAENVMEDLSEAEKERIMQDIRDGVAHLHSIGLVHNDLNPRNVMIAKDGAAVIIDFDWCRPTGEPLGPKGATMSWGKPDDVWSMAVGVLCEG